MYNPSLTDLDSMVYTNNVGNQRIAAVRGGENYANYTYDPTGQLTSDLAFESTGNTTRYSEQLRYGFDHGGNLAYRTNNNLVENFMVNSLNELTTNTNGGTLTVMGSTTTALATNVTVNGTNALLYGDATFAATNMPLTTTYTAVAKDGYGRVNTNVATVNLSTNVTFQYDGNGNLTNDGVRSFAYDDENQLIQVMVTTNWMSQFSYDGKMRRRIRKEFAWSSYLNAWNETNEVHYVYDGNLVIQERDINNLPTVTYTRGKDLSGRLEGAGGIGGLLARTSQSYADASLTGESYYHCDGNGNVTMLINTSNAIVAKYLYDAFGNILSQSGLIADVNHYRFSSKEWHQNSGITYYLYRYYDPNLQRWINRDPLGESGFDTIHSISSKSSRTFLRRDRMELHQYTFIENRSVNGIDSFGLKGLPDRDHNLPQCMQLAQNILDLANAIAASTDPDQTAALRRAYDDAKGLFDRFCGPDPDPEPEKPKCPVRPKPTPPTGPTLNQDGTPDVPPIWIIPILEDCAYGFCLLAA